MASSDFGCHFGCQFGANTQVLPLGMAIIWLCNAIHRIELFGGLDCIQIISTSLTGLPGRIGVSAVSRIYANTVPGVSARTPGLAVNLAVRRFELKGRADRPP